MGPKSKKFDPVPTAHGHEFGECASALQKSIRRGLHDEALYWAAQLDIAGYTQYLWRRLKVIACEDVGMADPLLIVEIEALHRAWAEIHAKKQTNNERLFIAQAVLRSTRARKSRLINDATNVWSEIETGDMQWRREVPDYALDMHTRQGREMGRGLEHFFDEGAKLEDEVDHRWTGIENVWEERVHELIGYRTRVTDEVRQPILPTNGDED